MYLIFAVINPFALSPVTGADDSNNPFAVGKAHRQHASANFSEAVISLLSGAMRQVLRDNAPRIGKSELRLRERNAMFRLVFPILLKGPIETRFSHTEMVSRNQVDSHIYVWLLVWAMGDL